MNRRVAVFTAIWPDMVRNEVNEFAKTHKIIQISYSMNERKSSCMVLYEIDQEVNHE